jgi:hypothetical protein
MQAFVHFPVPEELPRGRRNTASYAIERSIIGTTPSLEQTLRLFKAPRTLAYPIIRRGDNFPGEVFHFFGRKCVGGITVAECGRAWTMELPLKMVPGRISALFSFHLAHEEHRMQLENFFGDMKAWKTTEPRLDLAELSEY